MIFTKMKNYKIIASLVCFAAVFGVSNAANAKPARCQITIGTDSYSGTCDFLPKKGGSFKLLLPQEAQEIFYISNLSVSITAPGKGRLGGEDNNGRFYTAGQVRRDPKRTACWVGNSGDEVARVCAY